MLRAQRGFLRCESAGEIPGKSRFSPRTPCFGRIPRIGCTVITCINGNMQVGKPSQKLAVKVQLKLQRRRAQARRGDLTVVLQLHVRVDEVFGEDVAFGEEFVVVLQGLQRCLE